MLKSMSPTRLTPHYDPGSRPIEASKTNQEDYLKYLLIAAALSLGFSGACSAQTSTPSSNPNAQSQVSPSPQTPTAQPASASVRNKCHIEGQQLVCSKA
jgi:hypothetical protein